MPANGFAQAKAASALRIQCFELNRGDRPRYGDSIEGETFGGDASGEELRLPFGASRSPMTLTDMVRAPERSFQGVWSRRSGSAGRESTITSEGGLDSGDPKVNPSQGRRLRTYRMGPAQGSVPTPSD